MQDAISRQLIADYLKSNGYLQTLACFQTETSTPTTPAPPLSYDLQQLVELWLQQKVLADQLAKTSLHDRATNTRPFDWHVPIANALPRRVTKTLRNIHISGILSLTYAELPKRVFDTRTASYKSQRILCIVSSAADKRIAFTNIETWELEDDYEPDKAVTLAVKLNPVYPLMLSGAMNGSCTITNLITRESQIMREHTKYVVRVAWSDNGQWFCSLGYDKTVCIYEVLTSHTSTPDIAEPDENDEYANMPTFTYKLRWKKSFPTNPETAVFLPDSHYLAFCRRDDNSLNYVELPRRVSNEKGDSLDSDFAITSYNLNENMDAHISFCVLSLAIHPSKQAITLQTDTDIARIMILPFHSSERMRQNLYTNAEQSVFSNPRHSWLNDGTGVAVSSDDGIIRIVDLDGKTKASISAHGIAGPPDELEVEISSATLRARYESDRGSSVVRDLCILPNNTIVSCGLDKTIRICAVE